MRDGHQPRAHAEKAADGQDQERCLSIRDDDIIHFTDGVVSIVDDAFPDDLRRPEASSDPYDIGLENRNGLLRSLS